MGKDQNLEAVVSRYAEAWGIYKVFKYPHSYTSSVTFPLCWLTGLIQKIQVPCQIRDLNLLEPWGDMKVTRRNEGLSYFTMLRL